jgi:hypothetical protein
MHDRSNQKGTLLDMTGHVICFICECHTYAMTMPEINRKNSMNPLSGNMKEVSCIERD